MSTTATSAAATVLEDRPNIAAPTAERPALTGDAPPPRKRHRAVLRRVTVGTVAAAAVIVGVQAIVDDIDSSVDDVVVDDPGETPLDVHGIPLSWSSRGGAPRHEATELDIHGIPTWWSGGAPAPRHR